MAQQESSDPFVAVLTSVAQMSQLAMHFQWGAAQDHTSSSSVAQSLPLHHAPSRRLLQQVPTWDNPTGQPGGGRSPIKLPPHVYLISFVLLIVIISLLLGCHCYRMFRLANRARQHGLAADISPSGKKGTPQTIIDSLPVLKFAFVRQRQVPQSSTAATSSMSVATPAQQQQQQQQQSSLQFPFAWRQASGEAEHSQASKHCNPSAEIIVINSNQLMAPGLAAQSSDHKCMSTGGTDMSTTRTGNGSNSDKIVVSPASGGHDHHHDVSPVTNHDADDDGGSGMSGSWRSAVSGGAAGASPTPESCAICFDEFQAEDDVKELPCHHFYHVNCIDSWLIRDVTCPLCKQSVADPDSIQQQRRETHGLRRYLPGLDLLARRTPAQQQQQQDVELAVQHEADQQVQQQQMEQQPYNHDMAMTDGPQQPQASAVPAAVQPSIAVVIPAH
eukprot:jgi/Chrzof1/15231/Cz09g32100.t1